MRVRLQNDRLARILHNPLYERMLRFCEQYTPEIPGEPVVEAWLARLYAGDSNLHILVDLSDNFQLKGHAVVDVQYIHGQKVVWCYQAYGDKGNESLDEGAEYVDELCKAVGATCSMFMVSKSMKALERKYGYKMSRTVMIKTCDNDNS